MRLRFWKSIGIGLIIYILCLIPSDELQKLDVLEFRFTDLVVHLLMFLTFSAVLFLDLKKYRGSDGRRLKSPFGLALVISLTLAVTTEMLQYILTSLNRTANLMDLLFDTAGTVCGIFAVRVIRQRFDSGS